MDTEAVQALAKDTMRLRRQSLDLCANCGDVVVLSRKLRALHRALSNEHAKHHAVNDLVKLHVMIARRLRSGRLPYASVPIVNGVPGDGGTCDACDQTLTAAQLAMAVPVRDTFVRLHADCYMIWNEERIAGGLGGPFEAPQ